jgi:hypothetical protein
MNLKKAKKHIENWLSQGSTYMQKVCDENVAEVSDFYIFLAGGCFGLSEEKFYDTKPKSNWVWSIRHKKVPSHGVTYWDELSLDLIDLKNFEPQYQFLLGVYFLLQSSALYSDLLYQLWLSGENFEIMVIEEGIPIVILPPNREEIIKWFETDFANNDFTPEFMPAPNVFARIYWQNFLRKQHPKKSTCSDCGSSDATHAHHDGKEVRDLAKEGIWHRPDAHKIVMLCAECHETRHKGTNAANFLKVFTTGRQKRNSP